jgi:hypothetical protein
MSFLPSRTSDVFHLSLKSWKCELIVYFGKQEYFEGYKQHFMKVSSIFISPMLFVILLWYLVNIDCIVLYCIVYYLKVIHTGENKSPQDIEAVHLSNKLNIIIVVITHNLVNK